MDKKDRLTKGDFHEKIQFDLFKKSKPDYNWVHLSDDDDFALYDCSYEKNGVKGFIDFRQRMEKYFEYTERDGIMVNVDKFEFALNNKQHRCHLSIYFDNLGLYTGEIHEKNLDYNKPFSISKRETGDSREHKVVAHIRDFNLVFSDECYKRAINAS